MHNFLNGVKIIELGHILLGPYAGQTLGDLGAEVIKVEAPEGDFYRSVGTKRRSSMSAQWLNCNRNKRSISINLKTDAGRDIMRRLVLEADVLIHNMRPKAVAKLGFDYESVRELNPGLVYCFSSGFGQSGPYRDYPAFDDIIQARSGLADLNGIHDNAPRLTPMPITDLATSQSLTQAVLAGLYRKSQTGKGCRVEVPMFETFVGLVMNQHLDGHAFVPPVSTIGYPRMLSPFRKACATKDGFIVHGVYNIQHWRAFLTEVGREDVVNSDLLSNPDQLGDNIATLYKLIAEEILPSKSTEEWLIIFQRLDIPCAPVTKAADIEEDAHIKAVELFRDYDHPTEGRLREVRSAMQVTDVEEHTDLSPPLIGEHTVDVLTQLGYSDVDVSELIANGAVSHPLQ